MTAKSLVDVDDPTTWPAGVLAQAKLWAKSLRGTTEYVSDLGLRLEDEDPFRELLRGSLLVAYHATRLLAHEADDIRLGGLALATEELVNRRISRAFQHGDIDQRLHDLLMKGNVFAEGRARNREEQVCLVLSRMPFDHSPPGFDPLLAEWGGELITMSGGGAVLRPALRQLGQPSIVVAKIDLSEGWRKHLTSPWLHHVFVGRLLELDDVGASVHYGYPVPPQDVVEIWQPGHPQYDRHTHLPRC